MVIAYNIYLVILNLTIVLLFTYYIRFEMYFFVPTRWVVLGHSRHLGAADYSYTKYYEYTLYYNIFFTHIVVHYNMATDT